MEIVVIAGAKMTKYRTFILSARMPINGFNNEGMRWITDNNPARDKLIENFSMISGSIGARNAV